MSPTLLSRVRRAYTFRALGASWREHLRAVRRLEQTLRAPSRPSRDADVVVTINSFRRPENIELIAHLALRVPRVREVVVSQNDPEIDLARWVHLDDPRLRIVTSPRRHGPVTRYLRAREAGGRWFLSVDDDLFLHPAQLGRLIAQLEARPDLVHGFYGQCVDRRRRRWRFNLGRSEARVDVINRAYAFTDAHLTRYFELLGELGIDDDESLARFSMDDVPLAFATGKRPRVHDLGAHVDCPTEVRRGTAIFLRPGEPDRRLSLFERLERIAPREPDPGPEAKPLRRGLSPRGF